jgi:hypothetical protein
LSRPTIVLAPPDDEGTLYELLLVPKADGKLIFSTTHVEIERMVDKGLLDVVRLGPRSADEFIKAESIRRNFGLRVLAMRPARPFTPGTPAHQRSQPPGRLPPPVVHECAFISRRKARQLRRDPKRKDDDSDDNAHSAGTMPAATPEEPAQ